MILLKNAGRVYGVIAAILLGVMSTPTNAASIYQSFVPNSEAEGGSMSWTEFNLSKPKKSVSERKEAKGPSLLGTLSLSFTDATHGLLTLTTPKGMVKNTWAFDVTAPENFHANIFVQPWANGSGSVHHGNIDCPPVTPVPLPGAAWLLMSGIGGLAAFRSKRLLSQR